MCKNVQKKCKKADFANPLRWRAAKFTIFYLLKNDGILGVI
jgi:hypothetical protein